MKYSQYSVRLLLFNGIAFASDAFDMLTTSINFRFYIYFFESNVADVKIRFADLKVMYIASIDKIT